MCTRSLPSSPTVSAGATGVTLASSSSSVARWLSDGDLVLLHPGVVALPERVREWDVRARAATLWTRGPLSHGSALNHLGLLPRDPTPVHVTGRLTSDPDGCRREIEAVLRRRALELEPSR